MSMIDTMDEALLGDDDELDYDLEKDEEDALLADPENYEDENYDENPATEENYDENVVNEDPESDVLDIDVNVALDETEEDVEFNTDAQGIKNEDKIPKCIKHEPDEGQSDQEDNQKQRERFLNERNNVVQRSISNEIPDSLDKVTVKPTNIINTKNRFQRSNRGRGKGRQNHNRGSVFGRVGNIPTEGKTVLINPHFRGNVQVNSDARLVWDANVANSNHFQAQRFTGPQMAQVAPFQNQCPTNQISPWINQPYGDQNTSFNQSAMQPAFQDSQYNQQDILTGGRILVAQNNQHFNQQSHVTSWNEEQNYSCDTVYNTQGNFRGREVKFTNTNIPPLMMPVINYNNQNNFQGRNFNDNNRRHVKPFINQNHVNNQLNNPSSIQIQQQNYSSNFDQSFVNQNQYSHNQIIPSNQNFQTFNQQQMYDTYDNQNQYNNNQFANNAVPYQHSNQNSQGFPNQNFNQHGSYESQFNSGQQFTHQQYENRHFNQNRNIQQRQNRTQSNFNVKRTPVKRRPFENKQVSGDREMPKKKKRSLELSNLHEVTTVDILDTTTTEKKIIESEDEETKAYRLKIEEQKKLREKILREKEERRKLAAAQKTDSSVPADSIVNFIKDNKQKPIISLTKQQLATEQQKAMVPKQQPTVLKQIQQIPQQSNRLVVNNKQIMQRPAQQGHRIFQQQKQQQQQHPQQHMQRQQLQQGLKRGPAIQQQGPLIQQLNQPGQNICVQTNTVKRMNRNKNRNIQQQTRVIQPVRLPKTNQQSNIVVTQNNAAQQQPQRIVLLKQVNMQKTNPNRRIVLKGLNGEESAAAATAATTADNTQANNSLSSFLTNRKVITNTVVTSGNNPMELGQGTLIQTPVVVVSNLADGTSEMKIRKLCQGLGPVQNIQMMPKTRQATIRFKNIISAHKFFKKYQRKIIDLSMVKVTLEPLS